MKNKFCKKVSTSELKVGDRVLIRMYGAPHLIGYVESTDELTDGTICAYVDVRWRSRRKAIIKWFNDNDESIPVGRKFQMVFSHNELWVTNMKRYEAVIKAGLPLLYADSNIPF